MRVSFGLCSGKFDQGMMLVGAMGVMRSLSAVSKNMIFVVLVPQKGRWEFLKKWLIVLTDPPDPLDPGHIMPHHHAHQSFNACLM